jgi:hypothetical protein
MKNTIIPLNNPLIINAPYEKTKAPSTQKQLGFLGMVKVILLL